MEALGRLFDLTVAVTPADLAGGPLTGKRIYLRDWEAVTFVYVSDAGTAGEDVDLTIQEHNASTAGTSQNLAVVTRWWKKREATLDGDETWVLVTQTASATVDLEADEGENENLCAVTVNGSSLSDGFSWISCSTTDSGATAGKLGCVLAILHDGRDTRSPDQLKTLLAGA